MRHEAAIYFSLLLFQIISAGEVVISEIVSPMYGVFMKAREKHRAVDDREGGTKDKI